MVNVYTNEEYSIAYAELLEILKYFSKSDLRKIPQNVIKRYLRDRNTNYSFKYNTELNLEQQSVSKLTQILLANLYIQYFADEIEQEYIKNKDLKDLALLEKQNQEKYNVENIFCNRKAKSISNTINEISSLTIVPENKNIFQKIFFKIKCFLKLTYFLKCIIIFNVCKNLHLEERRQSMNYFLEITKKVEDFCNTSPSPDFRTEYLKSAEKINELYLDAISLGDEGVNSNDERIVKIYKEITKIIEG